jgi:hypothetical protein
MSAPRTGGDGHHLPTTDPSCREYWVPHCGSRIVSDDSSTLPPYISVPVAEFLADTAQTAPFE